MLLTFSAAIWPVASDAMVSAERPAIASELIAAMSLVENVAMSSVLKAAICFEVSALTWLEVKAST